MAEAFSIALAVVTASIGATKSLVSAVERFKGRHRTMRRLWDQLNDLVSVLESLKGATQSQSKIALLLKGPVERCKQLCCEFEVALKEFSGKPRATLLDFAKMEFRKGDINEFMDTLSGYKSTISVGVGTITLQEATATKAALEQFGEIVESTSNELSVQLQRINEKLADLPSAESDSVGEDLKNDRAMTELCIRVCEDAMQYVASLSNRERHRYTQILANHITENAPTGEPDSLRTHRRTRDFLDDSRDRFAKEIGRLQERLANSSGDGSPGQSDERDQLRRDMQVSEECLEVCKVALGEVNKQKIHSFGEVVADGDSDQVVVTTVADLFSVGKASSKGKSAQLIGSMLDDTLVQVSNDRYQSRFGTYERSQDDMATSSVKRKESQAMEHGQGLSLPTRAVSNEAKKRAA